MNTVKTQGRCILEIYFRGESSLDSLAVRLRDLLNIPSQNKSSYQRDQKRYGVNRGGEYFLFEIFGLELMLLDNKGEVEISERPDWPYYAVLIVDDGVDQQIIEAIAEYLVQITRRAGLEAEVNKLSA